MNNEFLTANEEYCAKRKSDILCAPDNLEIKGKIYYVSSDGNDENDGTSPNSAWRTLDRVNKSWFCAGDGVLFRRGDLFRGEVYTKAGVTYGAYGEGEKPKFFGWDEDLAKCGLWTLFDAEKNIWKYVKKLPDAGTLVFDGGKAHSRKLIPSYVNLQFVCRGDESRVFDMRTEMTNDLDIFWKFDTLLHRRPSHGMDFPIPQTGNDCYGELYLKCDRGNPGEVFDSIEAVVDRRAFWIKKNENVHIDNICMKYYCFGVSSVGTTVGLSVTNCEIGWVGGNIQHYAGTDPNYPEGTRGSVTRFGNAVEIYGGCENYTVSNCYIYQSYDAGITHQLNTRKKAVMKDVSYTDNLIEYCVYGIEYFLDQLDGENESYMENVRISGNIIRNTGYGWGQQRHNTNTPAAIKSWSFTNPARNYSVCNNIFDRSAYRLLHLVAYDLASCPKMSGNTYIQSLGGMLGQYGENADSEPPICIFDENAEQTVKSVFCEDDAKVYIIK